MTSKIERVRKHTHDTCYVSYSFCVKPLFEAISSIFKPSKLEPMGQCWQCSAVWKWGESSGKSAPKVKGSASLGDPMSCAFDIVVKL